MNTNRDRAKYLAWKRRWYIKNRNKEIDRKKKYFATTKGKSVLRKSIAKYRSKFPDKQRARWLLNKAVERGNIKRLPCEICGFKNTDGHHKDYSKPLVVIWVCRKCHGAIHRGKKKIGHGSYRW